MSSNADNQSHCYYSAFRMNNHYSNGDSWGSNDGGVTWGLHDDIMFPDFPWLDFCFKTYGKINAAPTIPTIKGRTQGEINNNYDYKFNSTDSENDNFTYIIN